MAEFPPTVATCARHPDRAATATCERCGSFTCDECNVGRTSQWCQACRELVGTFPFARDNWTFDKLWDFTWAAFKRDWLMLSVGVLIYLGVSMVVSMIGNVMQQPFMPKTFKGLEDISPGLIATMLITQVLAIAGQGTFEMGLYRIYLDVLQGGKADVARIVSQLPKLGRYIAQKLVLFAVTMAVVGVLAGIFFAAVGGVSAFFRGGPGEGTLVAGISLLVVAILVLTIVLLPLQVFATPELVFNDGVGAIDALKNAWAIGSGKRLWIFLFGLLAGVLAVVGMVLCCLPVLPAIALGQMLMTALYLALRKGSGLMQPVTAPGARNI